MPRLTRRQAASTFTALLLPAPPWRSKAPEQWSPSEMRRILNDSPWTARAVVPLSATPRVREAPGPVTDYDRLRMRTGAAVTTPSDPMWTFLIRWESAEPVRLALRRLGAAPVEEEGRGDRYIVTILNAGPQFPSGRLAQPQGEAFRQFLALTWLRRRHRPDLHPVGVSAHTTGPRLFSFYFQPEEPITLEDGSVEFACDAAPGRIRCRFALKEMLYQGRLAL